jgi:ribonuclease Z
MNKSSVVLFASGFLACMGLITCVGLLSESSVAEASSEEASVQKGVYFPNTETLASNEMRVISCGTGLPTPLTKAQKSACFMVELGNGDIFLFDIGTGSVENLFAIQPRFAKLDKVFLSHLHTDHF